MDTIDTIDTLDIETVDRIKGRLVRTQRTFVKPRAQPDLPRQSFVLSSREYSSPFTLPGTYPVHEIDEDNEPTAVYREPETQRRR